MQPNKTLLAFDKFVMNVSQQLEAGQGAVSALAGRRHICTDNKSSGGSRRRREASLLPAVVPTIVFILAVRVIWAQVNVLMHSPAHLTLDVFESETVSGT